MPRIFVAHRQEKKKKGVPKRLATGGLAGIKNEMKEHAGTKWLVAYYNFKPSVENIVTIIKDLSEMEAEETYEFEVNDAGRLRQIT